MAQESGQTIPEKTEASTGDGKHMHVKVYAPFKVYYDGQAESISAENDTGPFDILPKHHHFISLLSPCEIVVRNEVKEEKVKITRGIMHVKADEVIVFLDV
jgi:F0F1-type ATP synthase epsilon subunit